jgi:tRNA A-37 threonylcarbamoyl transferase component Bud32
LGRKTLVLEREVRGLNAFRELGVQVPQILSFQKPDNHGDLVLSEISGARPLDQALAEEPSGPGRGEIIGNLARVVGALHQKRWTHGALYPAHILVAADNSISLIDLEKAKRSFRLRRKDLERFFRYAGFLEKADIELFKREYRIAVKQK